MDQGMTGKMVIDTTVINMLRGLRLEGDPDPLIELSETFVVESASRMQQLTMALASGDHVAVRRAAHCLKGMSATIGALNLSEMSRDIEFANAGTVDSTRVGALEEEIVRVTAALNAAAAMTY
jgi:HPt (histidine-containing phosphotransfer) domain-containing protein